MAYKVCFQATNIMLKTIFHYLSKQLISTKHYEHLIQSTLRSQK